MKKILALAVAAGFTIAASAIDFDSVFTDSTLRIDYMLSGAPGNVNIAVRHMHKSPVWGGRTVNLDRLHYLGNGDITVTSLDGDTLYRNSFSTLFNEWLDLGDSVPTVCQCPQLIPMPRSKVRVTTRLFDKRHATVAQVSHEVDPSDILIRCHQREPLPHRYLRKGTADGDHVGVVFMGEGYQQDEMDQFYDDALEAVDAILSHQPFDEMCEVFDFIAVETPSVDSGVSVPKNNDWRNSSFQSHYSTFYSDRYLTSPEVFSMYDALHGIRGQHIIVLVNTEEYGGGGIFNNYTLTSARHPKHRPVVVHEFGHSFGGLADEYFYDGDSSSDTYPTDVEPWEPNVTALVDFGSKWHSLLGADTPVPTPTDQAEQYPVGVYEGAAYSYRGLYRPADYCRMRVNDVESFCPVCQQALRDIIHFYTMQK